MKRVVLILLLCAALLSGCGSRAAAPEAASASLQAGAVMGRSYVPMEPLPRVVTPTEQGAALTEQGVIWRAAESPDGRAALYRLNSDTVLIEWTAAWPCTTAGTLKRPPPWSRGWRCWT